MKPEPLPPPSDVNGHSSPLANGHAVLRFPADFLWGAATAATQIEGHVTNEWTGYVAGDGGTCDIACDHYHRYVEDVEWLTKLGVKGYRMGIEWSRLQSRAGGPLNERELARYCDLLDRVRAAGITPMVVLHHFSNPQWISAAGGWRNPQTIKAFVDYVGKLVRALKSRVRIWNTFNEPDTYASCTYLLGEFPPGHKLHLGSFRRVVRHMAEAHQQVCKLIRETGSDIGPVEVGFTKNWTFFQAYRPYVLWDRCLAGISDWLFNGFVLKHFLGDRRHETSTYLGINYYGRVRFNHFRTLAPVRGFTRETLAQMGIICDDMFERHPPGMATALLESHRRYGLPIYVTEHGSASNDENFRADDLKQNLKSVHRAISHGADIRGFFYWSLLDNFEWQFGYSKKFGLVAVDFADKTLPRQMKPLGELYRKVCEQNSVS